MHNGQFGVLPQEGQAHWATYSFASSHHSRLEQWPSLLVLQGFQSALKEGNGAPCARESPQEKTQQCTKGGCRGLDRGQHPVGGHATGDAAQGDSKSW